MEISIISPIYKGEKMLDELVSRIKASVETITKDYEIILVNDCSPDDSWNKMIEICEGDNKVKGINLSRNFGQHYAITAGLTESIGEWVVVLDCDLQDPPEEIPNLYRKAQEGFDTVFATRVARKDRPLKKITARAFNRVFNYLTEVPDVKTNVFGIFHRKVIDAVLSMGDYIRCFPREVGWVGFKIGYHPVVKEERAEGTSGYTWLKLFSLSSSIIISFSNKPLKIALKFGFFIVLLSILLSLYYLIRYFVVGVGVSGFTTIVISMWLIAGIIISLLGVIGIYLGSVFDKVKGRPNYIIKEKINFQK